MTADTSLADRWNLPSSHGHDRNLELDTDEGTVIAHNCADRKRSHPVLGPAEGCCVETTAHDWAP